MEKKSTKRVWNVGKCIANVSCLLFCICGIILIALFFGGPLIHKIWDIEASTWVTYCTNMTIVGFVLFAIMGISNLSMIKVPLKKKEK